MFGRFSVFNTWTEIRSSFEGNFLERVAPGAFAATLARDRRRIRVLFQHGKDPQIGDKPLGTIEMLREDEFGVAYSVRMLATGYNRELEPGLRAGVYGASFRFQALKETVDQHPRASAYNPRALPERTLREVRLLEFGPVTFPAYAGATAGIRSLTDWYMSDTREGMRGAA
jgi:hypothetical protein